jgi:hypothetical protein
VQNTSHNHPVPHLYNPSMPTFTWEACDGLPAQLARDINNRYLHTIADARTIPSVQADLQAHGYRLINPRFELVQVAEPRWIDLTGVPGALVDGYWDDGKVTTLVNDGTEKLADAASGASSTTR